MGIFYLIDMMIKGIGIFGNMISSNVNGVMMMVGSDGMYMLNFGIVFGILSNVIVIEVDEIIGDKGMVIVVVIFKKLNIISLKMLVDLYFGELDLLISDSVVVVWLVK